MRNIFLFLLLFLLPLSIFSQNWKVIHEDEDEKIEVNPDDIYYIDGGFSAKFRFSQKSDQGRKEYVEIQQKTLSNIESASDPDKWVNYSYTVSTVSFDCTDKRIGAESFVFYDKNGNIIITSEYGPDEIDWFYLEPDDSLDWQIMDMICKSYPDLPTTLDIAK